MARPRTGIRPLTATALAFAALLSAAARPDAWDVRTAVEEEAPGLAGASADQAARFGGLRDAWLAAHGGTATVRAGHAGRGTGLEWEAARALGTRGGAGVHAGWLEAADLTASFRGTGALLETADVTETLSASLSWLGAECWLSGEPARDVQGRLAFFAGPAWGSATLHRTSATRAGTTTESAAAAASASGVAWMSGVAAEAGWEFAPRLRLSVRTGYRWARVGVMRFADGADLDGDGRDEVTRGAVWRGSDGAPLAFDFGGAFVSLGVRTGL